MSDSCVSYNSRTEVATCLLIHGNGESTRLEPEAPGMVPEDSSISRSPSRSMKCRNCSVISLVVVVALCAFIVGIFVTKFHAGSFQGADTPQEGRASTHIGNMKLSSERIDYRINPHISTCEGPSCYECRAQVKSSKLIPGKPMTCRGSFQNVINSSCFDCNGECKTLDYLQTVSSVRCGRERIEVTCCLLSHMGNVGQICGNGGNFSCYSPDVNAKLNVAFGLPICKCPHGQTGERCQDVYQETKNCKCFNPAYPFCGQEEMVDCDSENTHPNVSHCRMKGERGGESSNCYCKESTGETDSADGDVLEPCTVPHTEPQTNDARKLDRSLSLVIFLMVVNILKLVDKT